MFPQDYMAHVSARLLQLTAPTNHGTHKVHLEQRFKYNILVNLNYHSEGKHLLRTQSSGKNKGRKCPLEQQEDFLLPSVLTGHETV